MTQVSIKHFHLFCGLGGGAAGFNDATSRVGNTTARFDCLGGIDSDPEAIADFNRQTGVSGTVMDLFDRDQYTAWHGHAPPAGWREATPADIRRAAGNERPHIVFTSSPCKGLSSLMSGAKAAHGKYQALNQLTVRGIHLTLAAWQDDPPEFILFENVPQIANRGRALLDQIQALLQAYGYAVAETTHDCGELGGLAQRRKRFLLVARHEEKVPPFLYQPERRSLRSIGEALSWLPPAGDIQAGGPMHGVSQLEWRTWVRLALIRAGRDWRDLQGMAVEDGVLRDYVFAAGASYHRGVYGVHGLDEPATTVTSHCGPSNGAFSIADPRCPDGWGSYRQFGVKAWTDTAVTVTSQRSPGQGAFSIADPRYAAFGQHAGKLRVESWDAASHCVTGSDRVGSGALSVADPRLPGTGAVDGLPAPTDKGVFCIVSLDGTWHRPFTTLEVAALQGLVQPGESLALEGDSSMRWRQRIGNAVPRPTAQAIAQVMGQTLLLARAGETFTLSSQPLWVRPMARAVAVARDRGRDTAGEIRLH